MSCTRMRQRISRSAVLTLLCLGTLAPASSVRAQSESELLDIIHRLEERVEQLETRDQDKDAQPAYEAKALEYQQKDFEKGASWADRVRLSGSAETGWFGGGADSVQPNEEFEIWDSRFFVEAELARDVKLAETTLVRDVGFMFEWDLVRLGSLQNRRRRALRGLPGHRRAGLGQRPGRSFPDSRSARTICASARATRTIRSSPTPSAVPGTGTRVCAPTATSARSAG